MRPEAEAYIAAARRDLREAEMIAALPLARLAVRSAYYAAFHAAEALIFDRTGKVVKTHSGVRSEFARLLVDAPSTDVGLQSVLNKGYRFKELADYGAEDARVVTDDDAAGMIADATRFVARVSDLLTGQGSAEAG